MEATRDAAGTPGVRIHLKVVPGASLTEVAGLHGERLRVRVAAPPEGGKANRAVQELLAARLGVPRRAVALLAGASSPRKTFAIEGISLADVEAGLR